MDFIRTTVSEFKDFHIRSNKPLRAYVSGAYNATLKLGGWGLVFVNHDNLCFEASGTQSHGSHNLMYLQGLIHMISLLQKKETAFDCPISFLTNSTYLQTGIDNVFDWRRGGWKTADKTMVKHKELWENVACDFYRFRIRSKYVSNTALDQDHLRCCTIARQAIAAVH